MISIHTLKLTLDLNRKQFDRLRSHAYKNAKGDHRFGPKKNNPDVHVDDVLADDGIMVEYHDHEFKKKITLRVNPSKVLGGDDLDLWKPGKKNIRKLIELLRAHIDDYLGSDYDLNDLTLSRVEFTSNLRVGKKKVPEYIKLLHKIGRVKGFSPKYSKTDYSTGRIDKAHSFDLESKTNGIEFTAYNKEAQLLEKGRNSRADRAKGILRIEVRIKKRKTIRNFLDQLLGAATVTTEGQIVAAAQSSESLFMAVFSAIVPYGKSFRIKEAEAIVSASDYTSRKKEKMLSLLYLIPEKKSLYSALKKLDVRNPNNMLNWFAGINLSPITISQRGKYDVLDSLYDYLSE